MRAHKLLCLLALMVACRTDPEPRQPSIESMQRDAFGGTIVVRLRDRVVSGELLAIDAAQLYVLERGNGLPSLVDRSAVMRAELFEYVAGGFTAWGVLGTLSTISHGYLLVLSAPVWLATTIVTNVTESRHMVLGYPEAGWDGFARWARYPQGPPDRLRERVRERLSPPSMTPPVAPPL
jgi:hypothetical protein